MGATVIAWTLLGRQHLADVVMVYLLGTVVVSTRFHYGPSIVAAVLSVLCFNFFFIPPYYTLSVADLRHVVTFGVMLTVALVISGLTQRRLAAALERERLAAEAHEARLAMESERTKNALLSSVSHDLRTPLAVVTGAASTMLEESVSDAVRRELTETILQEADRLNRLVQDLLDMTRVESGALHVRKQWHPLEDVVGVALDRSERLLDGHEVTTALPSTLTLVPLDAVLIEQVLVNLLENAAKYSPRGAPIHVSAKVNGDVVRIEVADRGPGIPPGDEEKVFEKFHRGKTDERGAGLGLTICRGIVVAHGGRIWNEPREGGGASFRFELPIEGSPPELRSESLEAPS